MSRGEELLEKLRKYRPLLLACEAIGWFHMAGKANPEFLRGQGEEEKKGGYKYQNWFEYTSPPFPWEQLLGWVTKKFPISEAWPKKLTNFISRHMERNPGLLGLLQAGHAMASGIEKNVPRDTAWYLAQDATHMWLSSPFGRPVRNLLTTPPEVLTDAGWARLVDEIRRVLQELRDFGVAECSDLDRWWQWREKAIAPNSFVRQAFLSTLADTRLPNNEVTLWDQSYVAAALFKSAVAAGILNKTFPWTDDRIRKFLMPSNIKKKKEQDKWVNNYLKSHIQWRVLTIGFGTGHYEARAVKIGDWVGAREDIEAFFREICKFIEVDLALGSLVYRDDERLVFTFPGQLEDPQAQQQKGQAQVQQQKVNGLSPSDAQVICEEIKNQIGKLAERYNFETPPECICSEPTRSFVPMVKELKEVEKKLTIPVRGEWKIENVGGDSGEGKVHVCPVCQVRFARRSGDKQAVCEVCDRRRRGRLSKWLEGEGDTIWIGEVADENDRVALLTLSLGIEPWLNGEYVDSLRAQSIAECRRHNPHLEINGGGIVREDPQRSLEEYIRDKLSGNFDNEDSILSGLQEGYRFCNDWKEFYKKIVEDRAEAPGWDDILSDELKARWIVHQLFCKLSSPGRIYRFWRASEEFFQRLLRRFREIAAQHPNPWRTRRLELVPEGSRGKPRQIYTAGFRGETLELLCTEGGFLTITNLARCLKPCERKKILKDKTLELRGEDGSSLDVNVREVRDTVKLGCYSPVIELDCTPQRFRVLVPLAKATGCIEAAVAEWEREFGRVWDRMPLRIGVVAFPSRTSMQAVIEAARNLEWALENEGKESKTWRVLHARLEEGVAAVGFERPDKALELVSVPVTMPDGRLDAFYPYLRVEEPKLRYPYDFQHPDGQVYRHVKDLRPGDGVKVDESLITCVFMDTTARRFERSKIWHLGDFRHMREVWRLLRHHAPSLSALRGMWAELAERNSSWREPGGEWPEKAKEEWNALARAVISERLQVRGAALETLSDAADQGLLEWALEWHLRWLKQGLEAE